MQVFWDGLGLENQYSGIGQYGLRLGQALNELNVSPQILAEKSSGILTRKTVDPMQRFYSLRGKNRAPFIFHGLSNFNLPIFLPSFDKSSSSLVKDARFVLTVHDIIPLVDKTAVGKASVLQSALLLPRALERAHKVMCVSPWTLATLSEKFPAQKEKFVAVTSSLNFLTQEVPKKSLPRSDEINLIYVARGEKYKRLAFFFEVVRRVKNVKAVLLTDSRGATEARTFANDLLACESLKIFTSLDQTQLRSLFETADVYLHTSLYEGFGFPIAEALWSHTPAVFLGTSGTALMTGIDGAFALEGKDTANLDAWVDRVKEAAKFSRMADSVPRMVKALKALPTWKDTALLVKNQYTYLVS